MIKYSSQEASAEELFNFNDNLFHLDLNRGKDTQTKFYEQRKSWNVNVSSWIDKNVSDTFKGNIINNDNLKENLEENLVNLIYHIVQSGLEIDVDYDLIDTFVQNYEFKNNDLTELSNKEIKFLNRNLDQKLLSNFSFQF